MTLDEYNAIRKRASTNKTPPSEVDAVIICAKNGRPIHPDSLGEGASEQFKQYCESVHHAARDRAALLTMLDEAFDMADYFTPDAESRDTAEQACLDSMRSEP